MTDPDTILAECMAQHGVTDVDADAVVTLRFMRGWLAYKQHMADDGPWNESYLVALEEMVCDMEMSFGG